MAGVSLKTVTNVVHERPYVAAETRERVQAAIDQLGYQPSRAGRQLQSGRSHLLTLVVPRIDEPYLGALTHALITAATPRGYKLVVDETGGHSEREHPAASGYPGHGIDGVILSPFALDPEHLAARSRDFPMVLLGQYLPNGTADYVAIDNVASATEAVRHLAAGGRRRIGYVGAEPGRTGALGEVRLAGYRQGLTQAGLAEPPRAVAPGGRFNRGDGARGALQLLDGAPELDAVVCASDLMAVGAIQALLRRGRRVPEDVAVLGWDNIVDGQYLTPTLTTVAPDLPVLAEQTLDALISRIEGNRAAGKTYLVPHRLVVRQSTGGA